MSEEIRSFLTLTIPLDILVVISLALTVSRGGGKEDPAARHMAVKLAAVLLTIQAVHLFEECKTGFHERLPALFGFHPWSVELFLGFNLGWIAIWLLSLAGVRRGLHAALFPLWFLGIASILNLVAHPLLALAVGGYFPGLWTSPLCGLGGVVLVAALVRFTEGDGSAGSPS